MLGGSTNSSDFRRFLDEVQWARSDNMQGDFWLVIDGKFQVPDAGIDVLQSKCGID